MKKFNYYDIVKIISDKPKHAAIFGELGLIQGIAQNEETGAWVYGVSVYKYDGEVRRFYEDEIESTGNKANPNEFNSDEIVRVQVDPKTGEGDLVGDE